MSPIEILGVALCVVMLLLMIRENIWAWPVGLVDSTLYVYIFFTAKLYSDSLLQVVFCLIFAYGWWHWRRGKASDPVLPVTRMGAWTICAWIALGTTASVLWGEFMHRNTDAALPRLDAFILVFSLIAQWWQAQKRLENWISWILLDGIQIGMYWVKGLRLTSGLYALLLAMAVAGHLAWRKSLAESAAARAAAG
jgi:nicotinamide mononucleotide transporter